MYIVMPLRFQVHNFCDDLHAHRDTNSDYNSLKRKNVVSFCLLVIQLLLDNVFNVYDFISRVKFFSPLIIVNRRDGLETE